MYKFVEEPFSHEVPHEVSHDVQRTIKDNTSNVAYSFMQRTMEDHYHRSIVDMAIIEGRESNSLVSLLCAIRRILVSGLSDIDKERLIEDTFMNHSQLNIQECMELVTLAFSMILSDNMDGKNSAGWCILRSLEHSQQSTLMQVIDVSIIESLFTNYFNSPNVGEVPSLVNWCLKNGYTADDPYLEQIVRENVVNFLRNAHCRNSLADSDLLSSMAVLLETHLNCIPSTPQQLSELCQAVIRKLATLEMPCDKDGLSLFISNIRNVEKLLKVIADHTSDRRQLSAMYLRILYATVSDSVKFPDPSPALATILQVVDVDIINGSVQSILSEHSDNESLIRLMTMLCGWLVKWPRACHVNRWVLSLISKLEEENRTNILQAVVELNIEPLFNALLLPAMRPGVLPVVVRLLPTHCSSPEVFHKVLPRIPIVITQLRRERNNPVSRDDLRAVLNITAQSMHVFPGYRQLYEPIMKVHEACWQDRDLSSSASNSMNPIWRMSPPPLAARVGLHNLGNTCYMNSVLQALFMTHRFCTAVLQTDTSDRYQPVLCSLQRLFALLLHSRRPAISAEDLLNLTRPPGFSPGHQQDSSEFLIHLLDVLHEQEKNLCTYTENDNVENRATTSSHPDSISACGESAVPMDEDEDDDDDDESMAGAVGGVPAYVVNNVGKAEDRLQNTERHRRDRNTIVRRMFGGEWQIQIRCLRCRTESSHIDPFIDLQVCFPEDHAGSDSQPLELQALIQALFSPEKLSGDNSYHCDKCRSLQEGERILRVVEPPEYLILILKHFQYNPITRQRMKLMHKVHYTETLEIPLASNAQSIARYRLYAAVIHSGRSVDAGHYYTFTRDEEDCWLRMDDETVSNSNSEQLNLLRPPETPYMLFYCGTNGSFQPPVGSPDQLSLSTLKPGLAQLVMTDNAAYLQEERNRNKRIVHNKVIDRRYRTDDDDDDENNHPGSSCGGQVALNTPSNRFVY